MHIGYIEDSDADFLFMREMLPRVHTLERIDHMADVSNNIELLFIDVRSHIECGWKIASRLRKGGYEGFIAMISGAPISATAHAHDFSVDTFLDKPPNKHSLKAVLTLAQRKQKKGYFDEKEMPEAYEEETPFNH